MSADNWKWWPTALFIILFVVICSLIGIICWSSSYHHYTLDDGTQVNCQGVHEYPCGIYLDNCSDGKIHYLQQ
jgi:hypothetical protein